MTDAHPHSSALTFHGGAVGALAPLAVFLAGASWLAVRGAPDERGFWPVLLAALVTGWIFAADRRRYAETVVHGMAQPVVLLMIAAWLLAGALAGVLAASGFVDALVWSARALDLRGGAYAAAAFVACAVVSTSTGTSFGTLLICGPLLYPAAAGAGVHPGALLGAILGGATFGDSISPISDTTIASAGTQGADIGGTVRARLKYVLPAGLAAMAAALWLGGAATPEAGGPMTHVCRQRPRPADGAGAAGGRRDAARATPSRGGAARRAAGGGDARRCRSGSSPPASSSAWHREA